MRDDDSIGSIFKKNTIVKEFDSVLKNSIKKYSYLRKNCY